MSASKHVKSPNAFRTISEVSDSIGIPQHVLRFWESKFNQIKPMKRGGGRRYYRPEDVDIIDAIRRLLHDDGYTIKGAQKLLREHGVKAVIQQTYVIQSNEEVAPLDASNEDGAPAASLKQIRDRLVNVRKDLRKSLNQ